MPLRRKRQSFKQLDTFENDCSLRMLESGWSFRRIVLHTGRVDATVHAVCGIGNYCLQQVGLRGVTRTKSKENRRIVREA
ncbi:hypothetical protein TNIN_8471 [Trichonephila inaurata madagascariensis]|uniref:Uncharacterized protein n=1 Tax=Trichonephila inaurata madagascariensis TaxID=2747483 RepID=A0A8X7C1B4_9ARAC|nr:hypothetical protein TNIN_8471 [Trichonephila inaurata madagascariensis]